MCDLLFINLNFYSHITYISFITVTICSHSTDDALRTSFTQILLTKRVFFSQALTLAPWRWFLCKPKHVGAFLSNLECFSNSAFLALFASVGNETGFSIVDARCNHEVSGVLLDKLCTSYGRTYITLPGTTDLFYVCCPQMLIPH